MIRLRLTDTRTGTARTFEFESANLRLGARPGCDISLPLAELSADDELALRADGTQVLATAAGKAGKFRINDKPIQARQPLQAGDVIAVDEFRVAVLELPAAPGPATGKASDAGATPGPAAATPGQPQKAPQATEKRSSADYLALFFGPVSQYLDDEDVSEIMINGPDQIYVERKGKLGRTPARFINEAALEAAVRNVARYVGRRFDETTPRLDARLPDGSRVHAVLPPLARKGTVVAIRKFAKEKLTIERLIQSGSISPEGARLLNTIVRLQKNIIVSGPTSSGKTCVLNVLSRFIPDDQRILVIEDASELQLQQEHVVQMETRKADEHGKGEVSIRDLVHSSLRLRPDRLVIGEIRGGEALDLLQAMNTGHAGSMSTIHANGPVDALRRLETCALLSGIEIPLSALREQVCGAINVVIHTARLGDGTRKITRVSEVLGMENQEYRMADLLSFRVDHVADDGKLIGRHVGSGVLPSFAEEARIRHLDLDPAWFAAPGA